jgi:kumamolisin
VRAWLVVGGLALASVLAVLAGSVSVNTASAKVPVPQGISALLKTDAVFGPTDPNTPETVSFILRANNLSQLQDLVARGPGQFLSVDQFARQFGQSRQNVQALQQYLGRYGIKTTAYANNLDVVGTGTASQFNAALSIKQNDYQWPAQKARNGHPARPAKRFHGSPSEPLLPRQLASFVLSILGLENYPSFDSLSVRTPSLAPGLKPAKERDGDLTPADFAKQYDLPRGTGAGSTIGIVALASLDQGSAEYFWSHVLGLDTKPNRIKLVDVDGGAGPVSDAAGSGETTLDVEQAGALAPQASIVVYQAPDTDPGFLDAFFQAATDNSADTVSVSWGASETIIQAQVKGGLEPATYQQAFDEALLELAVQGQSTFVASGDSGAYTAVEDLGTTNLSVSQPSDSPWATSTGGTTLAGTVPLTDTDSARIRRERAWGWDWLWPHYADFGFPDESTMAKAYPAGGGGGYSALESQPDYQRQVNASRWNSVAYLAPTAFDSTDFFGLTLPTDWSFDSTPGVQNGRSQGRAQPDVSTNADPFTGYAEYYTFGDGPGQLQTGWGGTSFVAPQLSGAAAVIDANLGRRLGLWNPRIYAFATQRNSPFHVLDSAGTDNDNLFYTGVPDQPYNAASGLGTPDLSALQQNFAHDH